MSRPIEGDLARAGVPTPRPLRGRALTVFDYVQKWETRVATAAPGQGMKRAVATLESWKAKRAKFFNALSLIAPEEIGEC